MTTPASDAPTDLDDVGCLFFALGPRRWGVRLQDIQRVLPAQDFVAVRVPNCPPWVLGMAQIEGLIITLLDPARRMDEPGAPPRSQWQHYAVLLVEQDDHLFGLMIAHPGMTALIPRDAIALRAPEQRVGAERYLLARYAPLGAPDPEAHAAVGFLDVRRLVQDALRELQRREASA